MITIENPPVNALHPDVSAAIRAHVDDLAGDPDVRAVVLTGSGSHFVAGGDIEYFKTLDRYSGERYVLSVQAMQDALGVMPQPVIAAINGTCLGGGCELAMACDIRIADERAIFGQPEVTLGIIPAAGGTQHLPRLIPVGRAKMMLYTGECIDSSEALRLGLVDEIAPQGSTLSRALALAERIAKNAPMAVSSAKRAVNLGLNTNVLDGQRLEASMFGQLIESSDAKEGVRAFFEKRKPLFWRA